MILLLSACEVIIDISLVHVTSENGINCELNVCKVPVGETITVAPASCPRPPFGSLELWISNFKAIPNPNAVVFTCQDSSKLTSVIHSSPDVQSIGCKNRKKLLAVVD